MRDLKYLGYFENLLREANNELIVQAKKDGKVCVAFVCENTPEPLMNLDGTFSIRLSAPNTGSMDIATYYMTSFLCETSRALLERAIEGGFNFADCVIAPDGCTMINRCVENMELLKTMGQGNDRFFHQYMEIPLKADENGVELLKLQCRNHILTPLNRAYGIDTSDAAIRTAVAGHNEICSLIRAIGDFRKEERPRITGYEFHVLTLATYLAPKYLIVDKLRETLEELRRREPDAGAEAVSGAAHGGRLGGRRQRLHPAHRGDGRLRLRGSLLLRLAAGARRHRDERRRGRADPALPPVRPPRPMSAHDEHGEGLRP